MGYKDETQKMRKRNMKLFSSYKSIAWDYLFYYTIDFLFLTQIKHISAADVVLLSSIGSIFGILLQIPANIIIEFLGRKNSIIFGNIINCLYMLVFMLSGNFWNLIIAKFLASLAGAIKGIAEPSLLNESIPPSRYKSSIFAKINAKGAARYYLIGAISKIIAGFLFEINGYLPIILSLAVLVIVTFMSMFYIEPIKKKKSNFNEIVGKKQLKDIEYGFKYILKSERLKALILPACLLTSLFSILMNYQTSLLKDIQVSSFWIGMISAIQTFISSYASKKQEGFHNAFRNKSIMIIALMASISAIVAGIMGIKVQTFRMLLIIIIICYMIAKFAHGMYYTIMDRYFRNFTNNKIDTKVFAVKNLFTNLTSAIMGIMASFLLSKTKTAYAMIIVGGTFTILFILMEKYMKKRVGLKPEEYSKEERKYDELKEQDAN
ncbi:MAG: MFS transporter [Clostridia bacterium]|nr:MFS transporter [Clostridia bacterium]